MSERTATVSKVRPLARRLDDHVVGFVFRLTLEEEGQIAFDDIAVDVEPTRIVGEWPTGEVRRRLETIAADRQHPRVARLHLTLDSRLGVRELAEFSLEEPAG